MSESLLPKFLPTVESTILSQAVEGYDSLLIGEFTRRHRDVIHISRDTNGAARIQEQLAFFCPDVEVLMFPGWDCLPYDRVSPQNEVTAQRIETLTRLLAEPLPAKPRLVLTTSASVAQRVPPRAALKDASLVIQKGGEYERDSLIQFLIHNGYGRRETVREWGEFAVRGGIIDVFPPGQSYPLRLDFFDAEVESIRVFDPLSQITSRTIDSFSLKPMGEVLLNAETIENFRTGYRDAFGPVVSGDPLYEHISEAKMHAGCEHWLPLFYEGLETLFDYAPHAMVSIDHQAEESLDFKLTQVEDHYKTRVEFAKFDRDSKGLPYHPLPPQALYLSKAEVLKAVSKRPSIRLSPFAVPPSPQVVDCGGRAARSFSDVRVDPKGNVYDALKEYIISLKQSGKRVFIAGMSAGSAERLKHILEDHGITPLQIVETFAGASSDTSLVALNLVHGFEAPSHAFITEEDILGERMGRGARKAKQSDMFLTEASTLQAGDLVVHVDHGIGRYLGLVTLDVDDVPHDCLEIEYHDNDKLYVPVESIDVLSRFGSAESTTTLDKLGGVAWQARKAKAKNRIKVIAEHLMKIAAERALHTAEVIAKPDGLFDEFCSRFPHPETDDQLTAIEEVLGDMASGRPMDRLICGDVGFGKTEVAMRAAFVAAASGSQVAVVAPTTLLARQHTNTFKARFAGTGLKIGQLSRMVTPKEARNVKEGLKDGAIDIVIGTHAIFAKSIEFQNLGLLVVDEEQHFGVAQKERMKAMKADIHVLTLSATPIPRTLQMALSGVRQMSLITTPPVDRLAVRTFTLPFDAMVVREAILREQFRGGQTFYVCPRLKDIDKVCNRLHKFVPEAKFAVATGQMAPSDLEDVMTAFCDGAFDVLVSTNIIESGIDIPQANTLIIHNADMFGLSQLYQLRGRVGRSKARGYAYLTLPAGKVLTLEAQKRLDVMQSLDSLGAGFNVASHDMDIRGAGNLVGDEQSGHIKEVGVELYQQMLADAIEALRQGSADEVAPTQWTPQINLGVPVLIPEEYVSDLGLRLGLYRRLSTLITRAEIDAFAAELVDRFGSLPDEVVYLLEVVHLKQLCKQAGIAKIDAGVKGLVVHLRNKEFQNPQGLVHYIGAQRGTAKIRPDQSIVFIRNWSQVKDRIRGAREILQDIYGLL